MLSYRHAFHAGNFADVLKHGVLVFTLGYLMQKPKPLALIDTHAGAGAYDLGAAEARKTGEAQAGIVRFLDAPGPVPALWQGYRDAVLRAGAAERGYPGSPELVQRLMRAGDRLDLMELHPSDYQALAAQMAGRRAVRVHREDGLAALISRLPPPERRGLALIDPSYEVKSDYDTVVERLSQAHRRFATGVYLLWYPVIERARTTAFLEALQATGIPRQLVIEWCRSPDTTGHGMTGSGLVVINPPYTLEPAAREGLAWLSSVFEGTGPWRVAWLTAAA